VLERLGVPVLAAQQDRDPVLGMPDPGAVAELGVKLERPPQMLIAFGVVAQPAAGVAEVEMGVGEPVGIAQAAGRGQRRPLHREHLMHSAAPIQLRRQDPG
jgi:hypothetical protein